VRNNSPAKNGKVILENSEPLEERSGNQLIQELARKITTKIQEKCRNGHFWGKEVSNSKRGVDLHREHLMAWKVGGAMELNR